MTDTPSLSSLLILTKSGELNAKKVLGSDVSGPLCKPQEKFSLKKEDIVYHCCKLVDFIFYSSFNYRKIEQKVLFSHFSVLCKPDVEPFQARSLFFSFHSWRIWFQFQICSKMKWHSVIKYYFLFWAHAKYNFLLLITICKGEKEWKIQDLQFWIRKLSERDFWNVPMPVKHKSQFRNITGSLSWESVFSWLSPTFLSWKMKWDQLSGSLPWLLHIAIF